MEFVTFQVISTAKQQNGSGLSSLFLAPSRHLFLDLDGFKSWQLASLLDIIYMIC